MTSKSACCVLLWSCEVALLLACAPLTEPGVDLILTSGYVYADGAPTSMATALAIHGTSIVAIGGNKEIKALAGDATQEMVLDSHAVVPGFHDAWIDPVLIGRVSGGLNLRGASTQREVVAMVRQAAAVARPDAWIIGWGWDETTWPNPTLPNVDVLDRVEATRPVLLLRRGGRVAWGNSVALEQASISQADNPPAGYIERDASGRITGIVYGETAAALFELSPPATAAQIDTWLLAGLQQATAAGLTSISTTPLSAESASAFARLAAADELTVRVGLRLEVGANIPALSDTGGLLRLEAIGLRLDGPFRPALAHLTNGTSLVGARANDLAAAASAASAQSLRLDVHAQGDAAVQAATKAIADNPWGGMIVGADLAEPSPDEADAIPLAFVPHRLAHDLYWLEDQLGQEAVPRLHTFRSWSAAGRLTAWASDAPHFPLLPMAGAWIALRRQDLNGYPLDGWNYNEAIDVATGLRALIAPGVNGRSGRLAPGMPADFTVWSEDPFSSDPDALLRARAMITVVAGRVVFSRPLVDLPMTVANLDFRRHQP